MKEKIRFFLTGLAMGTADIIPGVSGGTMAFILGVYERLIAVIRSVNWGWWQKIMSFKWAEVIADFDLKFVIPLVAGIITAVIVMTKVIGLPDLLRTHPEPVYGLFFGLIAGSIWLLLQRVGAKHLGKGAMPWLFAGGVVFGFLVVTLTPTDTPDASWFYFICGMVAISAMLLPGVSGSFILLILGKYADVLDAISSFNINILFPFAFGCGIGLGLFARVVGGLLNRFHDQTVITICGILTGTLYGIWPFQDRVYALVREKERLISTTPIMPQNLGGEELLSLGLILVGIIAVMTMGRLAKKN